MVGRVWFKAPSWTNIRYKPEGIRLDEDAALKAVGCESLGGSSPSPSAMNNLQGRYYLLPFICKLKAAGQTNQQIADFFDCSVSTVKYILRNGQSKQEHKQIDHHLGKVDNEFIRVAAVHKCQEILTKRGWQTGEADPKCKFDVFALKNKKTIRIQVRSSAILSKRGWPSFKTSRLKFNTKECKRIRFAKGDFDYWFFYHINGDSWLIPQSSITNSSIVSMEGYAGYNIE